MGRVRATLTVGDTTIAIRSALLAGKLEADKQTIDTLKKALLDTNAERAKLQIELDTLRGRRWMKLGRWLRFLRVA